MHSHIRLAFQVALCCLAAVSTLRAQQTAIDSLNRRLNGLTARIDSLEAGQCPAPAPLAPLAPTGNPRTDSLAQVLQRLNQRVESLRNSRCAGRPGGQPVDTSGGDLAALRAAAAAAAGQPAPSAADTGAVRPPPSQEAPAPSAGPRGANLLNPEISATGDIRVVARDGRQENNGVAREFEVAFQSALDPYSNTKIFLTFEDEEVGVEEGYLYWTGLPGRIRLDVGKYRQQVGDLNRWHLHALPETEYPLVYQRYFGPEGLSGIGLSLYTNLPFSLGGATHEVWLQGTTAEGDSLLAGGKQPVLLGRLQNFWQLTRTTYAQVGFTALGGNNDDAGLKSRVLGLDFRATYRPPEAGTRRDVTFRAEGYRFHSNELGVPTNRYGAFLDLQARTSQRWVLGTRYDYVQSPRGLKDKEWRVTPNLTWWESEFVFLRVEGEHRHSDLTGSGNMLTLQAVWAMGPHKHETY
ncbi:MAG TPA: hypothetical protein VFH40_07400 [Gemmatimonadales bacterium]|nr:hypothetical protein [Gemmatimonadales bacterium]